MNNSVRKVIVCGSRTWLDKATIREELAKLPRDIVIIHGACRGADMLADEVACELGFKRPVKYRANWVAHGKSAGPKRNQKMLDTERPDLVIAFRMPGKSDGTDDMLERARAAGVLTIVVSGATIGSR